MAFELTWIPAALIGAGLKVAEVPGWANRGNGSSAGMRGVMCHHTAGGKTGNMPSLNVLVNGRTGLAGPLCQLGLGRDGTFYLVAAGRANHAGVGRWEGETSGNSHFIGIEAENTGAEPWPDIQVDAMARGSAALLKHMGQPAQMCCGHKEYALPAGRKPDPHSIDMDAFRGRVASLISGAVAPPPRIPATDPQGRKTLRRSSNSNPEFLVRDLQKRLGVKAQDIDGIFGPMTEAAVRRLQRRHGMVADGIVGPKTWQVLLS